MLSFLLIVAGCALLYLGAEWLVTGATEIAGRFNIPRAIAGLTLVALGTSAPELFVNLLAASRGQTDFAMSNVAGSNLANICLGFGICTLVATINIPWRVFRIDLAFLLLTSLVIVVALQMQPVHVLPFRITFLLTAMLAVYFVTLLGRSHDVDEVPSSDVRPRLLPGIAHLTVGSALLYLGAEIVLKMSQQFAESLGVPSPIIGLTLVAAGTSIPDITASIVASRKNENDIAVGNILGSNISNIAFVLNGTLVTAGTSLSTSYLGSVDFLAVLGFSGVIVLGALWRTRLSPVVGCGLIGLYFVFMIWRVAEVV